MKSNFVKKFKAIASTAHTSDFFLKKDFSKNLVCKRGHGNLVLITSS